MRISDWSSDVCSSDLVSEEKIAGIPYWTVADCCNEQERTVLAYADCLSQAGGRVPLEVFDKLKRFWNDEQIFEFTYITCLYDMPAVITRALRMEFDAREDPIVEVAAHAGFDAADFLSAPRPDPERTSVGYGQRVSGSLGCVGWRLIK